MNELINKQTEQNKARDSVEREISKKNEWKDLGFIMRFIVYKPLLKVSNKMFWYEAWEIGKFAHTKQINQVKMLDWGWTF